MPRISSEKRLELLRLLSDIGGGGHADFVTLEDLRRGFCPIPEHIASLDPDVAIILGDRGAGKTELFSALLDDELRLALSRYALSQRVERNLQSRVEWCMGFGQKGAHFPDDRTLQAFLHDHNLNRDVARDLWFAFLIRSLRYQFAKPASARFSDLFDIPAAAAESNYKFITSGKNEEAVIALDALDAALGSEKKYVVVAYDALDTLAPADYVSMSVAISGLLRLWTQYARRWRNIKPKIFLRSDLFRANIANLGPELSKMAALRTELVWSDKYLYTMLVKRLLATRNRQIQAMVRALRVDIVQDNVLGPVPAILGAEDARPLIERIASPYMGANIKKGLTYRWLLDHCRDGNGKALPRPFIQLFERAAQRELESNRVGPQVLHSSAFRMAVDDVSREQVAQAKEEWPWIDGLATRLAGETVPMTRRLFELRLRTDFSRTWGSGGGSAAVDVRPPADDEKALAEKLLELGIARARANDRIDVPDLYLAGLGLKRKGGVRFK